MADELDAISVNIYASVDQVVEAVKAGETEVNAVLKRARAKEIKFKVGINEDSVHTLDSRLNDIVGKKREFEVFIKAVPEKQSKAQFKADIEAAVNKGQPIGVKTKVRLDRDNINLMRQHIKDALKSITVDVGVFGVWKGWSGGTPPEDIINIRGGGGPTSGAPGGEVKHVDKEEKLAAQPTTPLKEEKAPKKQTSSTVVGGPAGTTRTTEETTSKTTVESKPAPGVTSTRRLEDLKPEEVIPKVKREKAPATAMQPSAAVAGTVQAQVIGVDEQGRTVLAPGAAQGATFMAGKHAGGGGEVVSVGQQRAAQDMLESGKKFKTNVEALLKAFNITTNPQAAVMDYDTGEKRNVAHIDFSGAKYPKKISPEMFATLGNLGVDIAAPEEDQLKQLREMLEDRLDEYNAVKYTSPPTSGEVVEDFMGRLLGLPTDEGPAMRPGKGGMRPMNPHAWERLFGGTGLTREQREQLDRRRSAYLEMGAMLDPEDVEPGEMRYGYSRGDLKRRKQDRERFAEFKEALGSNEHFFAEEMNRMLDLAGRPDDILPAGENLFDPDELKLNTTARDQALNIADFLESQLAENFPQQLGTLRRGGRSRKPGVNYTFDTIGHVRSILGRDPITGLSLASKRADEDMRELEAAQKRAESAFFSEKLEEFVGVAGNPPATLEQLPFIQDFQRVIHKRAKERADIAASRKALRGDRDQLNKIRPDTQRARFKRRLVELGPEATRKLTDEEKAALTPEQRKARQEAAELQQKIADRPERTERQHHQAVIDAGLTPLPTISATDERTMRAHFAAGGEAIGETEWAKRFMKFLRASDEELDKKVTRVTERGINRKGARPRKPLDPMEMAIRRGEIAEELLAGASGKHAEALQAEMKEITDALDQNKSMTRVQQLRAEVSRLEEPTEEGVTLSAKQLADNKKKYDLTRADLLEAQADEFAEEIKQLERLPKNERTAAREARIEELMPAIGSKRERAAALRAPYKEPEVELTDAEKYLASLTEGVAAPSDEEIERRRKAMHTRQPQAGIPDDAGEGPGTPLSGDRGERNKLNVNTSRSRLSAVDVALAKITSPQMASGMLRRTAQPVSQAEAEAAHRYLRGERAGTPMGGGGGGNGMRVFVTNWPAAFTKGSPAAAAGAMAASPQLELDDNAPGVQAAARFFGGRRARDIPPGIDPRVFENENSLLDEESRSKLSEDISKRAERFKQREELITARAPTVALGEAFQALFGGRPELVTAIQEAKALNTRRATLLRSSERVLNRDIPKLRIEEQQALNQGDARGAQRANRQIRSKVIDLDFNDAEIEDINQRLPRLEEEIAGFHPVLRSFATLTGGAITGTLIFGATLAVAQAAVQAVGTAAAPVIDKIAGYTAVARKVNNVLADGIRQQGGYADVVTTSALAQAGFSKSVADSLNPILQRTGTIRAGNKALEEQIDLFHTAENVGFRGLFNPIGSTAGLTRGTGGALGTPLFQDKGQLELLTELLPGGDALSRNFPLSRAFANFLVPQARQFTEFQEEGGLLTPEKIAAFNQGNEGPGVQLVNIADIEPGARDAIKEAQEKAFIEAGVAEPERQVIRGSGGILARVGTGGEITPLRGGGDINTFLEQSATARSRQDPALLLDALRARELPAQRLLNREQATLGRRLNSVQFGLQALQQPILPAGTGVISGVGGASGDTALRGRTQEVVGTLQGFAREGIQQLLDIVPEDRLGAVRTELTRIQAISKEMAGYQIELFDMNVQHTVNSLNNQLRITDRTVTDLAQLSGRMPALPFLDNLGAKQREIMLANRSLQELGQSSNKIGIRIQERQLNLREAIAGLGVTGETPEERALRLKALHEELADQRSLLENQKASVAIQGEVIPLTWDIEDITNNRNYQDALVARGLLAEEIKITVRTSEVQDQMRALQEEMSYRMGRINTDLQEGVADINLEMQTYASLVQQSADDWERTRALVGDVFDEIRGDSPDGSSTSTSGGGLHDSGGSGPGYASGGLFTTMGATPITVGEAGKETVAVLRNPRNFFADVATGGVTLQISVTGNTVRSDEDLNELVRRITNEVQHSLAQQTALRGLRMPA